MTRILLVGLSLSVLWNICSAANCLPYGHPDADSCSYYDRRHSSYSGLDTLLADARAQEHRADFLVNVTIGMYQYIFPCAKRTEAALVMFFENGHIPDSSSSWWNEMGQMIGETPLVGRRRRDTHFHSEWELLRAQLNSLIHDTGRDASCIMYLINKYKDSAAQGFKNQFPNFHAPTMPTTTPTTSVTTTPTTTPTPTTVPTTAVPSTVPTTQTTTPPGPTTTVIPADCTLCQGLDCLLNPNVQTCPENNGFCLTSVQDDLGGREIVRGCADKSTCDAIQNSPECSEIETHVLSNGLKCNYCCTGTNCNRPPKLLPDPTTLYHPGP